MTLTKIRPRAVIPALAVLLLLLQLVVPLSVSASTGQHGNGSITVIKDAQPGSTQDFDFNINQEGPGLYDDFRLEDDGDNADGELDSRVFDNLDPDEYIITESAVPGWKLSDIICYGAAVRVDTVQHQAVVTLGAGDNAACTFVNKQNGTLRVYKYTIPAADQTRFPISVATSDGVVYGSANTTIADGEYVEFEVSQGTYRVIESIPDGWSQTKNSCWDVVINAANLHQECRIKNTKGAKLNIKKDASPNNQQDFTFASAKLGTFTLDDDTDHVLTDNKQFTLLPAGIYTITEQEIAGWDLTDITCEGARSYTIDRSAGTLEVTLEAGDDVACTFSNVQRNAISGYKFEDIHANGSWDQGEPALAGWTITLTGAAGEQTIQTGQDGSYRFANLLPGEYRVCETMQQGWSQTVPSGDGCYKVALHGPGEEVSGIIFGNFRLPVAAIAPNSGNPSAPQVLGASTIAPAQLAETGISIAKQVLVGLTILSIVAVIHLINDRRKEYVQ